MEKQIEEQLKKLENELFSSFLGSSIASIVAGKSALRTSEKGISTQH